MTLAILSAASWGCCEPVTVPDRPLLPAGRPADTTAELELRAERWTAGTIAGVTSQATVVRALPTDEAARAEIPAARLVLVVPYADLQALLAERARRIAYEEALIRAGRFE